VHVYFNHVYGKVEEIIVLVEEVIVLLQNFARNTDPRQRFTQFLRITTQLAKCLRIYYRYLRRVRSLYFEVSNTRHHQRDILLVQYIPSRFVHAYECLQIRGIHNRREVDPGIGAKLAIQKEVPFSQYLTCCVPFKHIQIPGHGISGT
jgi:hypothetical protein